MRAVRAIVGAIALLSVCNGSATAAISVTDLSGRTPRDLALYITGCGLTVADVRYVGTQSSAGTFTSSSADVIGFSEGLILSSGTARGVVGPNSSESTTGSNSISGAADLDALSGKTTYDATVLEFDFVPDAGMTEVSFDYVFASEEYNEYANSSFNDVFAFFLNGNNVALLPDGVTPVSINNVNGGNPWGSGAVNGQYYLCNADECATPLAASFSWNRFNDLEMDGLTVVFTVTATVSPGVINRMRFAIADASDSILDSVVFIRAGSFGGGCASATASTGSSTVSTQVFPATVHGYPNPFRPGSGGALDAAGVTIRSVPVGGRVDIYTVGGLRVVEIEDGDGDGVVSWNARNSSGRRVESGVYVLVAKKGGRVVSRGRVVIAR